MAPSTQKNGNGKTNGHTNGDGIASVLVKATSKMESVKVSIPELKLGVVTFVLKSDVPLIMHRFDQKVANQLLANHMGEAKQKKGEKVPVNDFLASLHYIGKPPKANGTFEDFQEGKDVTATGRWGFPAGGLRAAAISACRQVDGLKMTFARGVFSVVADDVDKNLVEVFGTPRMRQDITRNANGMPDIRFRAEFLDWSIKLTLKYDTKCISPSQLANLFNQAGFSVGLGDWRPERDGSNGQFHVAGTVETKAKA